MKLHDNLFYYQHKLPETSIKSDFISTLNQLEHFKSTLLAELKSELIKHGQAVQIHYDDQHFFVSNECNQYLELLVDNDIFYLIIRDLFSDSVFGEIILLNDFLNLIIKDDKLFISNHSKRKECFEVSPKK